MGNKRTAPDSARATPVRPVSKRLRGPTGHPVIITPPRLSSTTRPSSPPTSQQPIHQPPPPSFPQPSTSNIPSSSFLPTTPTPSSLPATPARPPRMPRFDRDRAAATTSDRKLVHRLNQLSPLELVTLVKDVESRFQQLAAFEAEEIRRAQRLGFSSHHVPPHHSASTPMQSHVLQVAW